MRHIWLQRKLGAWLGRNWEATIRDVAISGRGMGNCWLEEEQHMESPDPKEAGVVPQSS